MKLELVRHLDKVRKGGGVASLLPRSFLFVSCLQTRRLFGSVSFGHEKEGA